MTSLEIFAKFYDENKDKIHMPGKVNYPLNYKKGNQWALSQCDSDSTDFANRIIRNTKYVSYEEFTRQLRTICTSFRNTYQDQKGSAAFVLILPGHLRKSNLWVSLLAFEWLRDMITDVFFNVTELYNASINYRTHLYRRTIHCIVCDDCVYTGQQITEFASFDSGLISLPNKEPEPPETDIKWNTWYDNNAHASAEYIKNIPTETFSVNLIVPYVSVLAKLRLGLIKHIRIPIHCQVFPSFSQLVNTDKIPGVILNEFKRTFQWHPEISAIYFDHKIADALSTFNKVYLFAPLFNCAVSTRAISFIDNCANTTPEDMDIYKFLPNAQDSYGEQCPPTYYKKIKYTLQGKNIADMPLRTLFASTIPLKKPFRGKEVSRAKARGGS